MILVVLCALSCCGSKSLLLRAIRVHVQLKFTLSFSVTDSMRFRVCSTWDIHSCQQQIPSRILVRWTRTAGCASSTRVSGCACGTLRSLDAPIRSGLAGACRRVGSSACTARELTPLSRHPMGPRPSCLLAASPGCAWATCLCVHVWACVPTCTCVLGSQVSSAVAWVECLTASASTHLPGFHSLLSS